MVFKLFHKFLNLSIKNKFLLTLSLVVIVQIFFGTLEFRKLEVLNDSVKFNYNRIYMTSNFSKSALIVFHKLINLKVVQGTNTELRSEEIKDLEESFVEDLMIIRERSKQLGDVSALVDKALDAFKKYQIEKSRRDSVNALIIQESLEEISDYLSEKGYTEIQEMKSKILMEKIIFVVHSFLSIFIILFIFVILQKVISQPLKDLENSFTVVAEKNFSINVDEEHFYAELKHLAQGYNKLLKKFRETILHKEAAKKALSSFLANMSHELRTPLNSIIGFSTLWLEEAKELGLSEEKNNHLKNINLSGHHLLKLINNILDLSKLNSGEFTLEKRPMKLQPCVQGAIDILMREAQERNLYLRMDYKTESELFILGDDLRIRQVLINLINNGLKFTEHGGVTVRITKESIDSNVRVWFEVVDTGVGIPDNKKKKVFKAFAQADDSDTTKNYGGTGLGLAICKNLVEQMGGKIKVEDGVECGTCFKFYVDSPLITGELISKYQTDEDPQQIKKKEPKKEFRWPSDWAVLVVDDDESNQKIIELFLKKLTVKKIKFADSGEQGLALAQKEEFVLVVLDLQLPGMNGYETLREIRKLPNQQNTFFMASSANAYKEVVEKMYHEGFHVVIPKPIFKNKLREALVDIVNKKNA